MKHRISQAILNISLPQLGIFAFALASVWSLFQMFNNSALHPTPLYWVPSALVEVVTAWLMFQAVKSMRVVTDTKASKRDKRFYGIVAGLCVMLATPTLWVSVTANRYEFQGQWGLALLFPVSCVACAVASAIPHVKAQRADERVAKAREDVRKWRDKAAESERQYTELERTRAAEIAELERTRAMRAADRDVFRGLCADLDGNVPKTAREVNRLLNDEGYYSVPDSTAASWV
jgi:hypothetical protein